MKKTIFGTTALLLALSLSACGASEKKATESTPETKVVTVEAMSTAEAPSSNVMTPENMAGDKAACAAFAEGVKGFKPPTAKEASDPQKYMEALKPLSAPSYKAAELASSPKLKEAFAKLGEFTEKGTETDPAIAQSIPKYVGDAREGCAAVGMDSSKTGL